MTTYSSRPADETPSHAAKSSTVKSSTAKSSDAKSPWAITVICGSAHLAWLLSALVVSLPAACHAQTQAQTQAQTEAQTQTQTQAQAPTPSATQSQLQTPTRASTQAAASKAAVDPAAAVAVVLRATFDEPGVGQFPEPQPWPARREAGPRPPLYPGFSPENQAARFDRTSSVPIVADGGARADLRFAQGDSLTLEAWVRLMPWRLTRSRT